MTVSPKVLLAKVPSSYYKVLSTKSSVAKSSVQGPSGVLQYDILSEVTLPPAGKFLWAKSFFLRSFSGQSNMKKGGVFSCKVI